MRIVRIESEAALNERKERTYKHSRRDWQKCRDPTK